MNAILAILGLSLLILAHEWGHFVCARKFNMPVREFGIGFPPRAWSKMKNGVEYSINWLPFGGFVKIVGEDGIEDGKEDLANSFARQKIWKRAVVLLAGITINLVIGYAVLVISNLVGTPPGVVVTEIAKDSPAEYAGLKSGDFIRGFAGSSKFIEFTSSTRLWRR
jgi:regulator of sigma E protease